MKLNAYILAADPTWVEASVSAYYDLVGRIVVSFDDSGRGWTGAPIDVDGCIERVHAIDRHRKCSFRPGCFARPEFFESPMTNDTHQRQTAMDEASEGADWVLQIDTDEILPNPAALCRMLAHAAAVGVPAVEWPMRVLFQRLSAKEFLEVCAVDGSDRFEYPGPIAVRPGVELVDARRTSGRYLRPVVRGDRQSFQISRPPAPEEIRVDLADAADAIVHNSWAREACAVRSKIASWGHNQGLKSWIFYYSRWKPAPLLWRWTRDFHPFARGLWPALKPCRNLSRIVDRRAGWTRTKA